MPWDISVKFKRERIVNFLHHTSHCKMAKAKVGFLTNSGHRFFSFPLVMNNLLFCREAK